MEKIIPKNTIDVNSNSILGYIPDNLSNTISLLDGIVQTHTDSLAVATITGLVSLCSGTTVALSQYGKGRPIILYGASFMQSGTGKSAGVSVVKKYLLNWKEAELQAEDIQRRMQATKEAPAKPTADAYLEMASAEGLECSLAIGSCPFVFLDELGLLVKMAKNDTVKQAQLKALMSIYDSGTLVTRRLKDDKRAGLVTARGMGLFAASTLGASNLSGDDIRDMISNGALNRFLVTFGGIKAIPLKDELTIEEAEKVEAFSRTFAQVAKDKQYRFDHEALAIYKSYHKIINETYMNKLYNQDDGAGLVARQLTFLQRLSCLFQICLDVENNLFTNNEVTQEATEMAYGFLDYLDREHFAQIGMYASSKTGKITPAQRVIEKLKKDPGVSYRKLTQKFCGVLKAEQVKEALDLLINQKRIHEKDGGYYLGQG